MPITLDMTPDLTPASAPQKRNLLLAPPSFAAHEEKLRELFTTYDRSVSDLQMLDRLSGGFVTLPQSTYDFVLILTDTDGTRRAESLSLLNRGVYSVLVPSMKANAKLQLQDGKLTPQEASEAILSGLVETEGGYEKPAVAGGSVPLKLGGRKKKDGLKNGIPPVQNGTKLGDDELIDEDTLLSEEDLKRPLQQRTSPPHHTPPSFTSVLTD